MNRTKEQWAAARGIPQAAICDEAQQDIAELHARIEGLEAEVARLKSINIQRIDECLSLARERDMLRTGDTCARHCEGTAYRIEARKQKHRADVLAATIRELRDVVTHDAETKADFIERVRGILAADPDARVTPNASLSGLPLGKG